MLRHFLRLSQETLGQDVNIHLGLGTCTMKYSPQGERGARPLATRSPHLHPWQDDDTAQGMLEAMYRFERIICEISGMDRCRFQPGGGSQAVYANARMIRAYHAARGEGAARRDHHDGLLPPLRRRRPGDGRLTRSSRSTRRRTGYPDLDALKAALSERTAGLMITNPEDTGHLQPARSTRSSSSCTTAGGLCHYDQANANGILGITRARDAGFDLCQFNLHKTFASPHCSMGMPVGAVGGHGRARAVPAGADRRVRRRRATRLDYDRPASRSARCGRSTACRRPSSRSYAWVLALGAEGLREVAEIAVLNNNYLAKRLEGVRGLEVSYADGNGAAGSSRSATRGGSCTRTRASRRSTSRAARTTSASRSTSRATSRGSCRSR